MASKKRTMRVEYESPDGSVKIGTLPVEIAWQAAQSSASKLPGQITLVGEYGKAIFASNGSGVVVWGVNSRLPGQRQSFDGASTICI